jgi:DNA-binding transcriptional LysR family regulator
MPEVRQLRAFAEVVRQGSISRAAVELHLSQAALSEAISKLEAELGIALLVRSSRGVTPTPAGRALAEEAEHVSAAIDRAVDRVRLAARGQSARLRVGFEATGAGPVGTLAQARFAAARPDVRLEPRRFDWGAEADALRAGACDVAFVWLPNDLHGLTTLPVTEERRHAALGIGHPLASRDTLTLADLDDEPIMWTRKAPRAWVDWWAVNPRPSGRAPRWGPENDNVEEMLEQVAAGLAYCLGPASMALNHARPDLRWLPVTDATPLRVVLAWASGDERPLITAFVETVRSVLAASIERE